MRAGPSEAQTGATYDGPPSAERMDAVTIAHLRCLLDRAQLVIESLIDDRHYIGHWGDFEDCPLSPCAEARAFLAGLVKHREYVDTCLDEADAAKERTVGIELVDE